MYHSKTDNVIKKLYSLNIDDINRLKNKSYIPIGMGGLGLCSLFGLATNESFNSMQAGIANMKMICHRFPKYANMANTYLNAGVRNMDNESVLRNPTAFRTKLRCLNLRRFENAAKAKIIMSSTNALIETVNSGKYDNVDEAILRVIESTKDLSEVKRKLLWDLSIKSYIDTLVGKLQSSQTAATLIGKKRCIAIYLANKSEARVLMSEMTSGKLTYRD
jgi:glutamyl/glutaminyl-tRNA synthetase